MIKKYKDGSIYEGDGTLFTKKRQGKGKMTYANGEIYEGEWVDDVRCGQGELYKPKSWGRLYTYKGEWKNDKFNGLGTFTDGYVTYSGSFVDGKYNGRGTLTKKAGSLTYVGEFKDGKKHGHGSEKCNDYTYTGEFASDKFHGKGKKTLPNGDYYDGTFYFDTFENGKVKITDENCVYVGGYSSNKYNGMGTLTLTDTTVYSGNFKMGIMHGNFTVTLSDGSKHTEKYVDGVKVEDKPTTNSRQQSAKKKVDEQSAKKKNVQSDDNKSLTTDIRQQSVNKNDTLSEFDALREEIEKLKIKATETKETFEKSYSAGIKSIENAITEDAFFNEKLYKYDTYRGQKNAKGQFHGFGVYTFANGTVYEGYFVNGKILGTGILTNNVEKYYGEVNETKSTYAFCSQNGVGISVCKNGTEYIGNYQNGLHHGLGILSLSNGNKYEGEFYFGKYYKKGILTYANGDVYEGEFSDKREGKGKLTLKDGTIYEGKFKSDNMNGVITVTSPDGTKRKEKYKNGELVEENKRTADSSQQSVKKDDKAELVLDEKDDKQSAASRKRSVKKTVEVKTPDYTKEFSDFERYIETFAKNARDSAKIADDIKTQCQKLRTEKNANLSFTSIPVETLKNLNGNGNDTYKGGRFLGKFDGYGKYVWAEGDVYEGEWKNDLRTGKGIYHFISGNVYEGQFSESRMNGKGVFTYADGSTEKGDFSVGKLHGYAVFVDSNGNKYEGEWKDNVKCGKGVFSWQNGEKYIGEWKDDLRNGKGIYIWYNGDKYLGEWKDDLRIGKGVYLWSNGDLYVGTSENNRFSGKGILYETNGNIYEGNFANDRFHGKGVFVWGKDTKWYGDKYEGDWKDGERTGKGVYSMANGDKYEGSFLNGYRHGKGVYYFANGNKNEGVFKNGNLSGKGKRTYANGDVYEGDFKNDKPMGNGIIYYANGDKYEGGYAGGKLHGKGVYTYSDGRKLDGEFENGKFVDNSVSKNEKQLSSAVKNQEEQRLFNPESEKGNITFKDVAGLEDVKEQINFHVLEPLKNPDLAKEYGITPGGKILLYGPPGTGKTLVARAIAGEIDAPFYSVSCHDFISKWLGESSQKLNNLFDEVEKHEKAIIFFDEFDSVAGKRDEANESKEIARFVATFLTRVDGFNPTKNKMLLLIAATNRPWAIDSAMIRGGRFDTHFYVRLPDKEAREFLVNKVLGSLPLDSDVDLKDLAMKFEGFGGGDITAMCDKIKLEAYKKSVKLGKKQNISLSDCETVLKNTKRSVSDEELARFEAYKNGENVE